MPTQSSAECQPGTSCLRRQEHQMRQMAHKSWRCVHGVDGRPSSGEHTASRWAEGASAQQREPWMHYNCDWFTACCHKRQIREAKRQNCVQRVTLFAFHQQPQSHLSVCGVTVWKNGSVSTLNVSDWSQNTVISTHKMWHISQELEGRAEGTSPCMRSTIGKNRKWLFSRNPTTTDL